MKPRKIWPLKPATHEQLDNYLATVYAYDTETEGLLGKLLFATASDPQGNAIEWDGEPTTIVEGSVKWMMSLPIGSTILIHNLGYDFSYFYHELEQAATRQGAVIEFRNRTDSQLYGLDVLEYMDEKPHTLLMIRDSYAVWGTKLEVFTETFLPASQAKLKAPFSYEDRNHPVHFDPSNEVHREYARRDVTALIAAWRAMSTMMVDHYGTLPGNTSASTAMRAWRTTNAKAIDIVSDSVNAFCRQGYFGGLTWNARTTTVEGAKSYDRNSSYPASMLEGVPHGPSRYVTEFKPNNPGIYRVKVHAPVGLRVPIIGKRMEDGTVLWPSGEFETTTTSLEINFATQQGYTFEIIEGYVWYEMANLFDDFIAKCQAIRYAHPKTPLEALAKLMQNSLYGKFGTKPERVQFVRIGEPYEGKALEVSDVEALGEEWAAIKVDSGYTTQMFHWAAWITASARIALLSAIYEVGTDHFLYCDTDSITVDASGVFPEHMIDQKIYGFFKLEKEYNVFRAECPKLYAGVLSSGKVIGAAKGLRVGKGEEGEAIWQAILNRREFAMFDIDTVPSAGVRIKTGAGLKTGQTRSVSKIENSSGRRVDEKGNVWPISLG